MINVSHSRPHAVRSSAPVMKPKSKPKSIPKPRFLFENDLSDVKSLPTPPVVFTGSRLNGKVFLDQDVDFEAVVITLKGSVRSTIKSASSPPRQKSKTVSRVRKLREMKSAKHGSDVQLLHLTHILEHSSFCPTKGTSNEAPFFFTLPRTITLPSSTGENGRETEALPPTVHAHRKHDPNRVWHDDIDAMFDVSYKVSAQLILRGKLMPATCAEREVTVLSTATEIPPPLFIQTDNCQHAYRLVNSTLLPKNLCRAGKEARLQVKVAEPRPFVMTPMAKTGCSSTELRLQISILGAELDPEQLRKFVECKVKISLEIVTAFYLPLSNAEKTEGVLVTSKNVSMEQRKLRLDTWTLQDGIWNTNAVVRTLAPKRLATVPSFSCEGVERYFAFVVEVEVGGLGKKMEVRVPVQALVMSIECEEMIEDEDVEVPGYVVLT
jgi:hypothetical protein